MDLEKYFYNTISNDDCLEQKQFLKFCPAQVLTYTYFNDTVSHNGIPKLCRHFSFFNPITLLSDELKIFKLKTTQTEFSTLKWQMEYVKNYLCDPEFKKTPKTIEYDYIVYSIFSYIFLNWSSQDLYSFQQSYPNVYYFCEEILQTNTDGRIVIVRGLPFTGATFRIVHRHLQWDYDQIEISFKEHFSLKDYISKEHLDHFQFVYNKLCTENWQPGDEQMLHHFESNGLLRPILEPMEQFQFAPLHKRPKYITGMACCGKTTFLQMLAKHGWLFRSRGEVGAFGGKAKSAAQISALHASIDYVLRKFSNSVIGDRGPIDNPLWNAIMPLCAPKYKTQMIQELILFFENTINEGTIGYFGEFKVVIFLDLYSSRNRKRMIARSIGGDCYRGRLPMYAIAQFMAYYLFAALFGLKIVTVPYNEHDEFDFKRAAEIGVFLNEYFGPATPLTPEQLSILNIKSVGKNVRDLLTDMTYPYLACILK